MTGKAHWDKWGFLPSVALFAAMAWWVASMDASRPWPLHFDAAGHANRWGDARELHALLGLQALMLVLFFCLDEIFADLGRWNFASALAAAHFSFTAWACWNLRWLMAHEGTPSPWGRWPYGAACVALAAGGAYALDRFRKPVPPAPVRRSPPPDLEAPRWAYWERCRAPWMDAILAVAALVGPASVFVTGVSRGFDRLDGSDWIPLAVVTVVIAPWFGGFRIAVTPERLHLAWGWLRAPWRVVAMDDIAEVEAVTFDPLRKFGGYGLRFGLGGLGFILSGRGVRVRTRSGKTVIFSADDPDWIADLLRRRLAQRDGARPGADAAPPGPAQPPRSAACRKKSGAV